MGEINVHVIMLLSENVTIHYTTLLKAFISGDM